MWSFLFRLVRRGRVTRREVGHRKQQGTRLRARVRGGGYLARAPRLASCRPHRSGQRRARQGGRLDPWPEAPVAAQAEPQRRVPEARLAQRPLRQRITPAMRREVVGVAATAGRAPPRSAATSSAATSAGSRSSHALDQSGVRVQRPGLAVAAPGLARIARRPGERTVVQDAAPAPSTRKRCREGDHDRPARRHPHAAQAEQQGRGTGLARVRQQVGRLRRRHGQHHGARTAHRAGRPRRRSVQPPVAWPSFVTRQPVATGRSASSALTGALIAGTPTTTPRPSEPSAPGQSATMPCARQSSTAAANAGSRAPKYWAP